MAVMLSLRIDLPLERASMIRFLDATRGLLERIRVEDGYIDCQLFDNVEGKDRLCLLQQWRDAGDLAHHVRGENFRRLLVTMDMLNDVPEVSLSSSTSRATPQTIDELIAAIGA